jgi:hypothetical protein
MRVPRVAALRLLFVERDAYSIADRKDLCMKDGCRRENQNNKGSLDHLSSPRSSWCA